jgi:hypothetical protein
MFGLIVRGHVQPAFRNIIHTHTLIHSLNHEFRLLDVYGRTPAASNRVLHLPRLHAWDRVQLLGLNLLAVLMNERLLSRAYKSWTGGLVFTKFTPLGLDLAAFAKQFLKRLLASSRLPSVLPHGTVQAPGDGFSWNFLLESVLLSAEPVHFSLKPDKKMRTVCEDQCKFMLLRCWIFRESQKA